MFGRAGYLPNRIVREAHTYETIPMALAQVRRRTRRGVLPAGARGLVCIRCRIPFLSQKEPPGGGNNNGKQTYTGHVWGWAGGGSACIHEYIPSVNAWTSKHCSVEYEEGVNDYPETIAKPGAWNDPNQFYGVHFTQ